MKITKHSFKPVPKRFHQSIENAVQTAKEGKKKAKILPAKRILIASAAILAVIPLAIYGFGEVRERLMTVEKKTDYMVQAVIGFGEDGEKKSDYPQYVKFSFTPPEEYFKRYEEGDKYHYKAEEDKWAFSLSIDRPSEDGKFTADLYAASTRNITVNGHDGYILDGTNTESGKGVGANRRAYYYNEEMNIRVGGIFTPEIADSEIIAILERTSITEGTEEDHDRHGIYVPESELVMPGATNDWVLNNLDGVIGEEFDAHEGKVTAKVEEIRWVKNVSNLDLNDFNEFQKIGERIDADGTFLPAERDIFRRVGNENGISGIDSAEQYVRTDTYQPVLVLATITYTNTTNEVQDPIGTNHALCTVYTDKNGELHYDTEKYYRGTFTIDSRYHNPIYSEGCSGDDNLGLYSMKLNPGETRTVTLGWIYDEANLDQGYIAINTEHSVMTTVDRYFFKVTK